MPIKEINSNPLKYHIFFYYFLTHNINRAFELYRVQDKGMGEYALYYMEVMPKSKLET